MRSSGESFGVSPCARSARTTACPSALRASGAPPTGPRDSALNPVRITTKADPRELITARFDDKLKRLQMGHAAGEDVWADLRGYAVLIAIYDLRQSRRKPATTP